MCGISGLISRRKVRENGARIKRSIVLQTERGNGLGAGYAAYGIYPQYKELYALHVMAINNSVMEEVSSFLRQHFYLHQVEDIPVQDKVIDDHPVLQRFFVEPAPNGSTASASGANFNEDDFTIEKVMQINVGIEGAYVSSSGKNLGVFKGVGTPEDIYDFFRLDEYEGYAWLAHNRFPTNTPGWWGGAHPFNLLGWSIVHNGEISSYGINKRYLETYGYSCNMKTDSEVVAYLLDWLIRKHGLSIYDSTLVLAPPYWSTTDRIEDEKMRSRQVALKVIYESAMLNGPFAILAGFDEGMFSITDNTKLRPMTVGETEGYNYFSSEIASLYEMEENCENVYTPRAGQPCIVVYEGDESRLEVGSQNS